MNTLNYIRTVSVILLCLCCAGFFVFIGYDAHQMAKDFRDLANQTKTHGLVVVDDAHEAMASKINGRYGILEESRKAVVNFKHTLTLANVAFKSQSDYWDKASPKLIESIDKANAILDQAKDTLKAYQTIGQDLDTSQKEITAAMVKDLTTLNANLDESQKVLAQGRATLVSMQGKIDDKNFTDALAQFDFTMKNVKAMSDDVREEIHRLTRPVAGWKQLVEGVTGIAVKAATVRTGVKK